MHQETGNIVCYIWYNIAANVLLFLTENVSASLRDVGFYDQTSPVTTIHCVLWKKKKIHEWYQMPYLYISNKIYQQERGSLGICCE